MTIKIGERDIDGVIADLEGTLTSREQDEAIFVPARIDIARTLLSISGRDLSEPLIQQKVEEYVHLANVIGWKPAFIEFGGDEGEFHRITRGIDRSAGIAFNSDVHQLLRDLRSRVRLGLLTRATPAITESICSKLLGAQWKELFSAVVCGDMPECPVSKPDPRAFQFTAGLLDVPLERIAMVGNTRVDDIIPAATLGMLTIFVGNQEEGPWDFRIERIEELKTIISISSAGHSSS